MWKPGEPVAWRSVHDGHAGYTIPMVVIADDTDAIALWQPPGTVCKVRNGRRGGPNGRSMLPGGWDGTYHDRPWNGSTVRVHIVDHGYSVLRTWHQDSGAFSGWYVNLEEPWRRSRIGFDSRDLILDVTVADDLSEWSWKDEDELAWAYEAGVVDAEFVRAAREQGGRAITDLALRQWPFTADWGRWRPDPSWPVPTLPGDWAE